MMGSAMTDNRMAICGCFMTAVVDQTQLGTSDRSRFQLRFEISCYIYGKLYINLAPEQKYISPNLFLKMI